MLPSIRRYIQSTAEPDCSEERPTLLIRRVTWERRKSMSPAGIFNHLSGDAGVTKLLLSVEVILLTIFLSLLLYA